MAYFLGSDCEVALTTEDTTYGVVVDNNAGAYAVSGTGVAVTNGIPLMSAANLSSSAGLVDLTGLDLSIGAMDEDVSYLGAKTPLKAEIHKTTTVTLTLKKKNAVFDAIYMGDNNGNIGRWGVKNDGTLYDGLEEPGIDANYTFGYRLAVHLKDTGDRAEVMTVANAQMTGHTITLTADGTQEDTLEFTSNVKPFISGAAVIDATTAVNF
tara:strand:- start:230 stop:859 length:630 start_codon:yes stop_codon:yes gene_type:complete